jgi:hypothetical protein
MKNSNMFKSLHRVAYTWLGVVISMVLFVSPVIAQEEQKEGEEQKSEAATDKRPVRNTFESGWLLDNQSVMVPVKGTLQMDINHRFGAINNGYEDFAGLFAPSNIRLGFSYVPVEKLMVGFGITKYRMTWDLHAKYALLEQTRNNSMPISLTYYGVIGIDTRSASNFHFSTDRYSYFNQLIIARKFNEKFSVQVAPSFSHFNNVEGFIGMDDKGEPELVGKMKNTHFAIATSARYKISNSMAILIGYDQPLTQHLTNNPHPNLNFGLEIATSSHAFQITMGNYYNIVPQYNNVFNQNDFREGQFVIGFNMTRLWNW